jgi:hypothetical protein
MHAYDGKPEIDIVSADQIKGLDSQTEREPCSFAETLPRSPFFEATQPGYFAQEREKVLKHAARGELMRSRFSTGNPANAKQKIRLVALAGTGALIKAQGNP